MKLDDVRKVVNADVLDAVRNVIAPTRRYSAMQTFALIGAGALVASGISYLMRTPQGREAFGKMTSRMKDWQRDFKMGREQHNGSGAQAS